MPTQLLAGPALILFQGQTFVAKGDIELDQNAKTFSVESALGGTLEERFQSIEHKVSLTLDGRVVGPQLAVLYAPLLNRVGAFLHQDNKALVIIQDTGEAQAKRRTYHNAEITKVPNLKLSSKATLHESMEFSCLHKTDAEIDDANSLFTDDTVAWPGIPGYTVESILTQCYHASWGEAAPWDDFYGREGASISFDLSLDEVEDDCRGVAGYQVTDVKAEATMIPVGPSAFQVSDALNHQGATAKIGGSVNVTDDDLTFSGTGFHLILRRAGITMAKTKLGLKSLREGEVKWVAGRRMTNNLMQPLVYVGTAAPVP